jgi:hypothetical protein
MIMILTMPCPHIGWSSKSAMPTPPMTVMMSTPPTISSVFQIDWKKAGSV